MFKFVVLPFIIVCGLSGSAFAANRGSAEDQSACEPDVHRLCERFIPDEDLIAACLRRQFRRLSPACKRVVQ